ncbi:acetyl-CoA C-acetyltransferase [Candidatus Pelagibacter sp.]|nr:acetyl-CoA C-acetyltransferase [Candidatus Pelagibacter sp.]
MSKKLNDVVITSALRTPIGTYKGSLKDLSADKLGALVIKEAIHKSNLNSDQIDEVIMGHVLTSGLGQNPARQASIHAGIPVSKPAHIINQVCGSGLRSIVSGFQSIKLEENKIIVSGGQENMSRAPHSLFYRENKKLEESKLIDTMINDGLTDSFNDYHMGVTAENVAEKFQISRDEQDRFALNSQKKAQDAENKKKFKDEIIKLQINNNKENVIFDKDEHPRNNLIIDDLKRLKTIFKENGTVTPGNSSGINDGAAATVLMTRKQAELKSIEPLVKVVSWASCGVEPSLMGLGPIPTVKEALNKADWSINDVDLFEINEAFAAQSIAVMKELKIPGEKVNVNGGAIALGHPIGASGTRILVTLIHEMIKQNKNKGCAALCIGGGMGIAMCVERN